MSMTYEQGIVAVLEFLLAEVRTSQDTIDCIVGNNYFDDDTVPALSGLSNEDYEKLDKITSRKWETLFKQHFGFTDEQYVDQLQAMFRASLTEKERVMLREMERICASTLMIEANGGIGGTYYQRSPKKLAWIPGERYSNWCSGVSFNEGGWTTEMGWTLTEVEEFLIKMGSTKKKRPVQKRIRSYSLYD